VRRAAAQTRRLLTIPGEPAENVQENCGLEENLSLCNNTDALRKGKTGESQSRRVMGLQPLEQRPGLPNRPKKAKPVKTGGAKSWIYSRCVRDQDRQTTRQR